MKPILNLSEWLAGLRPAAAPMLSRHRVELFGRRRPFRKRFRARRIWVAAVDSAVLIQGETGTGKEVGTVRDHRCGRYLSDRRFMDAGDGSRDRPPRVRDRSVVLIVRVAEENPDPGVPKIHAELQKLGFSIAERTVGRYLRR